jgi:hypothetical protein
MKRRRLLTFVKKVDFYSDLSQEYDKGYSEKNFAVFARIKYLFFEVLT